MNCIKLTSFQKLNNIKINEKFNYLFIFPITL